MADFCLFRILSWWNIVFSIAVALNDYLHKFLALLVKLQAVSVVGEGEGTELRKLSARGLSELNRYTYNWDNSFFLLFIKYFCLLKIIKILKVVYFNLILDKTDNFIYKINIKKILPIILVPRNLSYALLHISMKSLLNLYGP